MSFRIEQKLYIKEGNLFDFKKFLSKKSAKGIYEPRVIESLYFDNQNFETHTDSIEGLTPRKKIRIRSYPNHNDKKIYFEIKNSSVEGRFKTRKIIEKSELNKMKEHGVFDNQYGLCFPKMYVKYDREYLRFDDIRISIDTNITYRSYDTDFSAKDDRIIAELKTSIQKDMDDLIKDFPLEKIRFSKYCFGIERLFYH